MHHAFTTPESLTLAVSPSARQSGEFVRKAAQSARRLKLRVKGDGDNEMSIAFPNGSRLVGLPGNETTIREFSAVSLLLVDEAARVSEDLYLAVRPMLAVTNGAVWLLSTPFGKRGFFYEAWERGAATGNGYGCRRRPVREFRRISWRRSGGRRGSGISGRNTCADSSTRYARCSTGI